LITSDYCTKSISPDELEDLCKIADVAISDITSDDYPNLLVFPNSFYSCAKGFGTKGICSISDDKLKTNSIVGFVGRNKTHLSIHSRFAKKSNEDYFLHYMLQKVAKVNLLNLQHSTDDGSVFNFLLYFFPLYLKRALNQGLFKLYISRKYNDANVKGVIDVNRHIRFNEPFNGNIAYNNREHSYDNYITRLIRHTIDFIDKYKYGTDILSFDSDTIQAVAQIKIATPSCAQRDQQNIISKNLRPIVHPFYNEYTPLQRLCLQILRHEELKYGQEDNDIYGVLIDAAWLWEEYLAILLEDKYKHYLKEEGERFNLFENFQQIIPDFLSKDMKIVADAKYIRLNEENTYQEEKATSIYYKTITYLYRFCSNRAFLLYPHPDEDAMPLVYKIKTESDGINGGTITKLGLRIPSDCSDFNNFTNKMQQNEKAFLNEL
jgi:5-methylcytosine-specific restriction endonuclease McrBC regulatory subunit McrC